MCVVWSPTWEEEAMVVAVVEEGGSSISAHRFLVEGEESRARPRPR